MAKVQAEVSQEEYAHISDDQWLAICRAQLIEEGKMTQDEAGRFWLTAKGMSTTEKELDRYAMRPAMAVLIQHYVLQKAGILVD